MGRSISLRLVAFLLAAVVLFNLAMALAFLPPLNRVRNDMGRLPLPRQMAAIVDVLDQTAPAERSRLLTAFNSATLSVELIDDLPIAQAQKRSAPLLTRLLDRYDQAFASRDIHVDLQRQGWFDGGEGGWSAARLYVRLSDGKWVLMQPVRAALLNGVLWRGLLIVGIAGIVVIILLVIAARQTARPIERLASTARTFADKLDAPDIEEKGPKELRQLAVAFNDMKTRIRSLVQERTRLVAAIAHDLRTYMTRLRMRAEFISDPAQRERAEADIEEMSVLIGDTLLFARSVERGDQPGGTADVAAEINAFVSARKETGDAVDLARSVQDPMMAVIEPVALRRMLGNLTDNAIRYGKTAELSAAIEGDKIVIEVADRGPGIPEADLERIVAPFERLEPSRGRAAGGSGLGLAIVKALAEHHGGGFALSNRPGGGIIAKISLKVAA